MLHLISSATADPLLIGIPAVPPGLSPSLNYILELLGLVASVFLPLIAIWFKQYISMQAAHVDVQDTHVRSQMINGSIVRAAYLADREKQDQSPTETDAHTKARVLDQAVRYVKNAYPDAVAETAQATDEHIAQAVTAEMHKIDQAKDDKATPSVVISPVSALR